MLFCVNHPCIYCDCKSFVNYESDYSATECRDCYLFLIFHFMKFPKAIENDSDY